MKIKEVINKQRLIIDGSMGTYYSTLVNQPGAISEYANLSSPELIEKIHKDYISAGARIIRTNTFAANSVVLNQLHSKEQRTLVKEACKIAKKAVSEIEITKDKKDKVWVFGDIGPIPEDASTEEDIVLSEYRMLCDVFIEEGMEGIHFETFSSLKYIEKLVSYIKEKKEDMFILASFSVNKNGYTGSGISAVRLLEKISQLDGIDGCGLNCGIGSGHMHHILKQIIFPENKYIYAAPNAGYPEQMQNRMVFMDNAGYFADNMKQIAELGVDLIGGCCGTTPEYIKSLVEQIPSQEHSSIRKKSKEQNGTQKIKRKTNDFYDLFKTGKKVIAVELDPPYDANIDKIMECAHSIKSSGADIITFADSPMGRSRVDSILMSVKIAEETGLRVMPHICCRDRNMISMRSALLGAYIHGIRNLLIVTGDPVPGENRLSTTGVFDYNSIQLMDFVKEMNMEHFERESLYYGGALNYGRGKIEKVVERMKRKIGAGAMYFLTQPIYSSDDVERIRMLKERVDTKIICGVMPFVSYRNASFVKNEISGINVPDEIMSRYHPDMDREDAENVGAAIAREMVELLDPIADGYYFMLPFNRVSLLEKIMGQQNPVG